MFAVAVIVEPAFASEVVSDALLPVPLMLPVKWWRSTSKDCYLDSGQKPSL